MILNMMCVGVIKTVATAIIHDGLGESILASADYSVHFKDWTRIRTYLTHHIPGSNTTNEIRNTDTKFIQ